MPGTIMFYNLLAGLTLMSYSSAFPQRLPTAVLRRDTTCLQGLGDGTNFPYNVTSTPQRFMIDVDPNFIATTNLKVELYRPSRDIKQPDWTDGPPAHDISNVQKYWVQNYSWFKVQSNINEKYSQFMTTVHAGKNFTEPLHVHFAHQRSNRSDAIPLLLLHGWPSSFLEWDSVIGGLASPPNSSLPSFHAVAPDLPAYGFSPAPTKPGLGSREMGQAMDHLMKQLGYDKYAIYTTDLGSLVGRWMLYDAADSIISRLTDFNFVVPNATDLQRYAINETSPEENAFLDRFNGFEANDAGYMAIQTTRPSALTEALTDSPVGFLAWMWHLRHVVSGDFVYTPQDLITDAMMLYIQGPYGNVRSYKEFWQEGALNDNAYPSSNIPTGITHWHSGPQSLNDPFAYAPTSWSQRTSNVTFTRDHDFGGHFPAQSNPSQWLQDAWEFFGDASISGVDALRT